MDYKAKYERALKRAKSLYEQRDFEWSDKDIEQIFPELKESDDEKTRKELIERLKWELDGAEQQDAAGCSRQKDIEMFKRGIAWLEKQKPVEWTRTSEDEANMDAVWKACGQVYRIKYQGILGDWLKTLRPHENKDNKKYEGGYIDLTIAAIEEYYGDKNPLTSELVSWIKKQKQDVEPKPVEIRFPHYNDIIEKVFGACNLESWEYKEAESLVHLAKEELLKDLQEQKPKDWSKEDETMMQNILDCLRKGQKKLPTDILKYESWLKSLSSQSHWKPTKEQIETLEFAASYVDSKEDKSVYNSIRLLIDELERLM